MWKLSCKNGLTLLVLLAFAPAITASEYDAEILKNHEIREYDYTPTAGYFTYSAYVTIKRKIKVNSSYGINKFNTLYIPTFEDLDYKMTLVSVTGATHKPNGNVYPVNEKHIKETTLPANVPMLYGYEGNVKQMVFSNVSIGDIIEYEYKVRYFYTSSYSYFSITDELELGDDFPINQGIYEFKLSNRLDGIFHLANSDQHITNDKNNFSLTLLNIRPKSDERYTNNKVDNPYLLYNIVNDLTGVYDNWDKYLRRSLETAKRKEYFMMGVTVGDIESKIRLKRYTDTETIVKYIKQTVDNKYKKEKNVTYLAAISRAGLSIDDAEQVLKLIKTCKMDASVLFLKNRNYGNVYKSFISVSQFQDIMVKYKDKDGQIHFWKPLDPFGVIDQYSARYSGTEALELYYHDNKLSYKWYKMPIKDYLGNSKKTKLTVRLNMSNDQLTGNAKASITEDGQYAYYNRKDIAVEQRSDVHQPFTNELKSNLEYSFFNCNVSEIDMELKDDGEIEYSYDYDYQLNTVFSPTGFELNIRDFIPYIRFTNVDMERQTSAYLNFTRNIDYELKVEIDPSMGNFIPNEFLNRSVENSICAFTSTLNQTDNGISVSLNFGLKKDIITKSEWPEYVEVMKEVESFYLQKLIVSK